MAVPGAADLLRARPYVAHVPPGYDGKAPLPLLIVLHGYQSSGAGHAAYFAIADAAARAGVMYVAPDGSRDVVGDRFWNAGRACCDFHGAGVDDVAYLSALITDVRAHHRIDPRRIFLLGHSNGGFMSYRMACARADLIAGLVSLAGAGPGPDDALPCTPGEPVSVLQVHGDRDRVIEYGGGRFHARLGRYPSAQATVATWAQHNGCTGPLSPVTGAPRVTLTATAAGDGTGDTRQQSYAGCPQGAVELWTIEGGNHMPPLSPQFAARVLQFLLAHPKPSGPAAP